MNAPTRTTKPPELVNAQAQCKLCQLHVSDPELLARIHQRVIDGDPRKTIAEEANISYATLNRHVRKHVDLSLCGPTDAPPPKTKGQAPAPLAVRPQDPGAEDHEGLWALFDRIQYVLNQFDYDGLFFTKPVVGDDGEVKSYALVSDPHQMSQWISLMKEARGLLEGVNKVRNSNRVTDAILASHTRRLVRNLATPFEAHLGPLVAAAEAGEDSERIAEQLRDFMMHTFAGILQNAVDSAVNETREVYRLGDKG